MVITMFSDEMKAKVRAVLEAIHADGIASSRRARVSVAYRRCFNEDHPVGADVPPYIEKIMNQMDDEITSTRRTARAKRIGMIGLKSVAVVAAVVVLVAGAEKIHRACQA